MYGRVLGGRELTMGVSGKLWKNVLVIYDRQTRTLWSHLTGEGLAGPLKGERLETHPAAFIAFGEWRRLFPDTLVLDKRSLRFGGPISSRYDRDPYEGYYYSAQAGILPQKYRDNRLHPKTLVLALALEAGGARRAKVYPFADLNRAGVVNDAFAGRDLLVTYCESAKTGLVFDRRLEGRTLRFALAEDQKEAGEGGCRRMRDLETGSTWARLTGVALEGPLKGKALGRVQSTLSFWFGWKDYYPQSEIYRHAN